jgi:hypothetical protein
MYLTDNENAFFTIGLGLAHGGALAIPREEQIYQHITAKTKKPFPSSPRLGAVSFRVLVMVAILI